MKYIVLTIVLLFLCGCDSESMSTNVRQQNRTTLLLSTSSSGCKVYEIDRENCTVYVNNNGGIWVLPKE